MTSFLAGLTVIGAVTLLGWGLTVFAQDMASSARRRYNQRN